MTGHDFYIVCAGKWLVRSGVLGDSPPRVGGELSSLGGGGAGHEGGRVIHPLLPFTRYA